MIIMLKDYLFGTDYISTIKYYQIPCEYSSKTCICMYLVRGVLKAFSCTLLFTNTIFLMVCACLCLKQQSEAAQQ